MRQPIQYRSWLIVLLMYGSVAFGAPDPIDRLIESLPTHGLWINGIFPKVELPATATASHVVAECMAIAHIDKYSIVEVRDVAMPGITEKYRAVLVSTSDGQKIVLMSYENPIVGWWTRIYDAK
jgi:hypothetical protein